MSAPVPIYFRSGEEVPASEVPPDVVDELQRAAVASPGRSATVYRPRSPLGLEWGPQRTMYGLFLADSPARDSNAPADDSGA